MNKLILTACLMVSAAFASFGGIYWDNGWKTDEGVTINDLGANCDLSYTFDNAGSFYLAFGVHQANISSSAIFAFGYYFIDDPATLYSGTLIGNTSDYYSSRAGGWYVDLNTGYLGDFNAGDTIGIWIQETAGGAIKTTTGLPPLGGNEARGTLMSDGSTHVHLSSIMFHFVEINPPVGEPLPGVLAALAIGGVAFISRKIRNKMKK